MHPVITGIKDWEKKVSLADPKAARAKRKYPFPHVDKKSNLMLWESYTMADGFQGNRAWATTYGVGTKERNEFADNPALLDFFGHKGKPTREMYVRAGLHRKP